MKFWDSMVIGFLAVVMILVYEFMVPPQRAYEIEYVDAEHVTIKCSDDKYPRIDNLGNKVTITCRLENPYVQ